jgi:hypothetical protein
MLVNAPTWCSTAMIIYRRQSIGDDRLTLDDEGELLRTHESATTV